MTFAYVKSECEHERERAHGRTHSGAPRAFQISDMRSIHVGLPWQEHLMLVILAHLSDSI